MKKIFTLFSVFAILISFSSNAQNAWINEIHYDNVLGDVNEMIEVVVENPGTYTLSNFTITLYNGSNGTSYGTKTLDQFTVGSTYGNFTFYYYIYPSNGLQNGAPDGIAFDYNGSLIQFLSYEGQMSGTAGIANGVTSVDIGVSESNSSLDTESLQLGGNGTAYSAFTWQSPTTATAGTLNNNQFMGGNPGDITPPVVNSATALSLTSVKVVFSEAVDTSAENTAHYTGLGSITSASRTVSLDTVYLFLGTPLTTGVVDTLIIDGIRDTSTNNNIMATAQDFEVSFGYTPDIIPPVVLDAYATSATEVTVVFSEAINSTGTVAGNYTGLGTVSPVAAASLDSAFLTLTTALTPGVADTLTIANLQDTAVSPNTMVAPQSFIIAYGVSTNSDLVITEIMYNPPESGIDSLEFVEIYNNGATPVNFGGWDITYNTTSYTFPVTVNIMPGEYLVIAKENAKVDAFYGITSIQGPNMGLSNNGTSITLKNNAGALIDSVDYEKTAPWPTEPYATGPSLVLCDPSLDNNDGANWHAAAELVGTNGAGASIYANPGTGCITTHIEVNNSEMNISIFPNPSNGQFTVQANIENAIMNIYSVSGQLVLAQEISNIEIINTKLNKGLYYVQILSAKQEIIHSQKLIIQ